MKIKKLITLVLIIILLSISGNVLVISNSHLQETDINYLVNVEYHIRQQVGLWECGAVAITSVAELTTLFSNLNEALSTSAGIFWDEIFFKYNNSFFEDNFLIFIETMAATSMHSFHVTSIRDRGETISVDIEEYRRMSDIIPTPMSVPWTIVLEVDRTLLDRTFSIELPHGEPVIVSPNDPNEISVLLNGERLVFDVAPIIVENRTLVPFRAIFEALDMDVDWNDDTRTAIGTSDNITIELPIDSTTATVNGEAVALDVPAMLYNARTMVPLRFIAESTGADVE